MTGVVPLAHAFGERVELPIPILAFVLGGAAVVAVSFVVVLPTGVHGRSDDRDDVIAVRPVSEVAGVVAVIVLAALCWAGLAGTQVLAENILPTMFWVYVWVILPLLCGLLGDITSGSNPFGYLAQLGARWRRCRRQSAWPTWPTWPTWLGWWLAVVLLALGTVAELVFNQTTTLPRFIAWMLIGYSVFCVAMGASFGAEQFRARGELFTVLFGTWGLLGYFRFGALGRRGFGGGLDAPLEKTVSRTVFVLMLLVSISFDGILSTPQWARFERSVITFGDLHEQYLLRIAAFVLLVAVLYTLFALFAFAVNQAGGARLSTSEMLSRLLPSLVPIAFGYLLAHYLQYALINAQLILPLLGAPGGAGTDLHLPFPFNDSYEVHTAFLPNSFYWYVDVAVIVIVHIAAVVLAHRSLARAGTSEREARRAEYPWIIAMVAYTSLSLWLLAQPLTAGGPGSS